MRLFKHYLQFVFVPPLLSVYVKALDQSFFFLFFFLFYRCFRNRLGLEDEIEIKIKFILTIFQLNCNRRKHESRFLRFQFN